MSSEPSTKGPQRSVQIGKYKVLVHLATGGMGAVYKAYDTEAKRDVALKVLTPEMAAKPIMIERFRREARHAGKLRHENIVELYEFGEADGRLLHRDGVRRRHRPPRVRRAQRAARTRRGAQDHHPGRQGPRPRPPPRASSTATSSRPTFWSRARKGRLVVKMTDLGLSRKANAEEFRVTRAGTTVGTVDYISPEQARDSGTADIRSDLYSLGCTWYHLLAGKAPFSEGGLAERLHKHLNIDPPDVRWLNPRASKATAAVLRRLLAKRPADRYQTPADLLKDLAALKNGGAPTGRRAVVLGLLDDDGRPLLLRTNGRAPLREDQSGAQRAAPVRRRQGQSVRPAPADCLPRPQVVHPRRRRGRAIGRRIAVALALQPHRPRASSTDADQASPQFVAVPRCSDRRRAACNPIASEIAPADQTPDKPPGKTALAAPGPERRAGGRRRAPKRDRRRLGGPAGSPGRRAGVPRRPRVGRRVGAGLSLPGRRCRRRSGRPFQRPRNRRRRPALRDLHHLHGSPFAGLRRQGLPAAARLGRAAHFGGTAIQGSRQGRRRPPAAFLTVERGGLRLENLDVAFKQPEAIAGGLTLLDVQDADLSVEGCTFSLAGKPREGTVARALPRDAAGRRPLPVRALLCPRPCRDRPGPGRPRRGGADRPLPHGRRRTGPDPGSRAMTPAHLANGGPFHAGLRPNVVERAAGGAVRSPSRPSAGCGWDCLLSRSSDQAGGDMVAAPGGDGVDDTAACNGRRPTASTPAGKIC